MCEVWVCHSCWRHSILQRITLANHRRRSAAVLASQEARLSEGGLLRFRGWEPMVIYVIARAVDTEEVPYSLREVGGAVGVLGGIRQVGEVALLQLL